MGELLHIMRSERSSFLEAKTQRGHFEIDGVRMAGRYGRATDGAIEFTVWEDHISPEAKKALYEMAEKPPGYRQWVVKIPAAPVFEHTALAKIGFLTAGYLLWFRELGYSWALQEHLDIVRRRIQGRTFDLLPKSAVVAVRHAGDEPCIGFVTIDSEVALAASFGPMMCLFPPADRPDFYGRLPLAVDGLAGQLKKGHYGHRHGPAQPVGVIFGDRLVIAPDVFSPSDSPLIYADPAGGPNRLLHPVNSADLERIKSRPGSRGVRVKSGWKPTDRRTGGPPEG